MLLDETKAALMLGITKELLYAYVKTGAKGRKLKVNKNSDNKFFDHQELVEWNEFLNEPWAPSNSEKPDIPRSIKEYLKVESGGKCSRCGSGHRIDDAHILPWAESLSHHPHNLIRLCTDCHIKYDDGIISRREIESLKLSLVARIKSNLIVHAEGVFDSLHLIPNPDERFVGRSSELKKVRASIKAERLTIIYGIGGVGKTQLLINALSDPPASVVWFKMEQYGQLSDFYSALFKAFKSTSLEELLLSIDDSESYLVLDGLENLYKTQRDATSDLIKNLLQYSRRAKLIITSQVNFIENDIKSSTICLYGLPKKNWLGCLKLFVGKNATVDKHFKLLANYGAGHPLTLRIVGGLITFNRETEKVWNQIKQIGARAIKDPKRKEQTRKTSLVNCLSLMHSSLTYKQRWLLEYLAHFPAGFKTHFIEFISKGDDAIFVDGNEIDEAVGMLNQYNVLHHDIDVLGYKRTYLHSPIRDFIIHQSKTSKVDFHKIRLVAFQNMVIEAALLYSNHILSDQVQFALARYEMDLPNYLHAMQVSVHSAYCKECQQHSNREDYLKIITGLSHGLYKFLFTRGYFKYGIYFNDQGAKAHVELGEFEFAINDMVQVASLYWRMYNHNEALRALEKIKEYETKSGSRYAIARLIEAELTRSKEPQKAISIFEEGVRLCKSEILKDDKDSHAKSNLASLLSEIGKTYEFNLRDPQTAVKFYHEGYNIQKETKDYGNMYCNSHHLGNCYSSLNDIETALLYYKEALDGFIELGQSQYIGNTLWELGKMKCDNPQLNLEFLTIKKIEIGLKDIEYEIKMIQSTSTFGFSQLYGGLNSELVHKLWSIIRLVSLTEHSRLLHPWSAKMITLFKSAPYSYPWIFLRIAQVVHKIERNPKDKSILIELKKMCYLHGSEVEHDIYDPYQWLSNWLRHTKIDEESTRGGLFAEIEETEGFI